MTHPDFHCSIEDNHSILIIIHAIQATRGDKEWPRVFEAITKFNQLCFENTPREIHFRYQTRDTIGKLDVEANQQIHRRVFGLVCVAFSEKNGIEAETEKKNILQNYNGCLTHYGPTVLESRCLVFRRNNTADLSEKVAVDGAVLGKQREEEFHVKNGDQTISQSSTGSLGRATGSNINQSTTASLGRAVGNTINQSIVDVSNGLGHDLFRPVHKSHSEANLSAAAATSPTRMAKSYVEIRLQGALREQVSQIMEEFLLALFSAVEAKRPPSVPEKADKDWKGSNPSLTFEGQNFETPKKDGFRFDLGNAQKKKRLGGMKKIFAEWLLVAGMPYPACQYFAQAVELLQAAKETFLLAAALEGWAAASYYVLPAADSHLALKLTALDQPEKRIILTRTKAASLNGHLVNGFNLHVSENTKDRRHCLTSDVIFEKLRLAAWNFSCVERGDLELEVSLKLAKMFLFLGDKLLAHKGLRQATFVKINDSTERGERVLSTERVERFLTIAGLYEEMGFRRQAALFRLLAADRCIGPGSTPASHAEAFRLTVKSLGPYGSTLSTKPAQQHGWKELQAQVMVKLAATCRTQPPIYSRILLSLLENFSEILSISEKEEILKSLFELISLHGPPLGPTPVPYTDTVTGTDTDIGTDIGSDIGSGRGMEMGVVTLTKIPFVHEFSVMPLQHHLQPLLRPKLKRGISGPFIFTPIKSASQSKVRDADEAEFMWVAKEPCGVTLHLSNGLPREIKIENLTVITDDAPFEAAKASLVLPPVIGPVFPVVIAGIPLEPGLLTVLGYSFSLFGIENRCLVAELPQFKKNPPPRTVRVAPSLPQLRVETSWPPCDIFVDVGEPVVTTATMMMFNGQRSVCSLKLLNVGKEPIESLSVLVASADNVHSDNVLVERCVFFDSKKLESFLPILPNESAELELEIWAALSFVSSSVSSTEAFQFVLRVDYSGGPGLLEDFYRLISVGFFIEVLPSVAITQWAILAAEEPEQFYLVVDFENQTDEEIEVFYPPNKKMLIVGRESARIPALSNKIPLLFNSFLSDSQKTPKNEFEKEKNFSEKNSKNEFEKEKNNFENCQKNFSEKQKDISEKNSKNECQKNISEKIQLGWKFVEKTAEGNCWTGDLTWTSEQIESISLPPFFVEFRQDEKVLHHPRREGLSVSVGETVCLDVCLTNRFAIHIAGLRVLLEFREEFVISDDSSGPKIALIGGTPDAVLDFAAHEVQTLRCPLVMLIPGVFHLDVVFELGGRKWAVVDTCMINVSTMATLATSPSSPSHHSDSSTDM